MNGSMPLKTSIWKDFLKDAFTNALEFIAVKQHISKNFAGVHDFINRTCGSLESGQACDMYF